MGDIPRDRFLKTQALRDLYERLYDVIKDEDCTESWKEQWRLGIISDIETDEEIRIINKLIDMGIKDSENLASKALYLYFIRKNPRYFEGQNYTEEDFWDINKG